MNLSQLTAVDDLAYVIATYGSLVGTFNSVSGLPSGYTVDYNFNNANQIAVDLVPEPGTIGMVGLGVMALMLVGRWRNRTV